MLTKGQRLERQTARDFLDIVYSYAINGNDARVTNREWFQEYIYDLKPDPKKMESQPFDKQAESLMGELDAFRSQFPTA